MNTRDSCRLDRSTSKPNSPCHCISTASYATSDPIPCATFSFACDCHSPPYLRETKTTVRHRRCDAIPSNTAVSHNILVLATRWRLALNCLFVFQIRWQWVCNHASFARKGKWKHKTNNKFTNTNSNGKECIKFYFGDCRGIVGIEQGGLTD